MFAPHVDGGPRQRSKTGIANKMVDMTPPRKRRNSLMLGGDQIQQQLSIVVINGEDDPLPPPPPSSSVNYFRQPLPPSRNTPQAPNMPMRIPSPPPEPPPPEN